MARRPTGPRSLDSVTARLIVEARGVEVEDLWAAIQAGGLITEDIASENPDLGSAADTGLDGIKVGAAIGTALPGLGTVLGAGIGFVVGAIGDLLFGSDPEYKWHAAGLELPGTYNNAQFMPLFAAVLFHAWASTGFARDWAPAPVGTAQTGPYFDRSPGQWWPRHNYQWYREHEYADAAARITNTVARSLMDAAGGLGLTVSGGQTLDPADPGQKSTFVEIESGEAAIKRLTTAPPKGDFVTAPAGDDTASPSLLTLGALAVGGFLLWRLAR